MENRRQIKRMLFTYLLTVLAIELLGQNANADEKILQIESFKNYKITKVENTADLKLLSDNKTEVTEFINYQQKSKLDHSGKVIEHSQNSSGKVKRTYYFNENSVIFAIIENVQLNDNTTNKMTYYFAGGQLTQVIDKENNDVTSTINQPELYDWLIRMFGEQAISR